MSDIWDKIKQGKYESSFNISQLCSTNNNEKDEAIKEFIEYKEKQHKQFKQDALEYCGISKHPHADLAFKIAEEERNYLCYGKIEVLRFLQKLAILMKK